jgi:putative aldouronate transport system substrate-binding protein
MKKVKALTLMLAAMLSVSLVFAGCSKKTQDSGGKENPAGKQYNGIDVSKEARLKMYLVGDAQADAALVYDEVNKRLKEDINATVDVKYIPWADWDQKYNLILASGEELDLIYTAAWSFYGDQATKNAFKELDLETLRKYMPDYFKLVPNEFWNQVKIGGKIFMIPYINKQLTGHQIALIRGDLREKYGLPEVKTIDDFENYMAAFAKNENGALPYDGDINTLTNMFNNIYYKQPNNLMFVDQSRLLAVKLDDASGTVQYVLDDPSYTEALKRMKRLADNGMWSKNVLASKNDYNQAFEAGKGAFLLDHAEGMIGRTSGIIDKQPQWKPEVIDLQPDKIHQANSATQSGMALHARSKNVERALMMLNLFGTNRDYYDLTTYGIIGKHFEPAGNNRLKTLADSSKFAPKANCPWGWERKDWLRYPVNVPDEVINLEQSWMDKGLGSVSPLVSFNFVDTNVKNEVAAISNLTKTEGAILISGQARDVDVALAKYRDNLKKAGIEKVMAEYQKQINEYLNSLK